MPLGILLTLFAMFCMMRLLLELKLGGKRKLWIYVFGEDGAKTLPLKLLAVMMVVLTILMTAGWLPEMINNIVFYGVVPLVMAMLCKHEAISEKR